MFGIPLSIILGTATGLGINALRVFRSPLGQAAVQIVPHAVRLAWKVLQGRDAQTEAEDLLKLAPRKVVAAEEPVIKEDEDDNTINKTPRKTGRRRSSA